MADEPVTTPIHDLYAQRFAADLETNRKEQADLTAQIEELEVRLKQLKSDENWLCGVQGVLPPAGAAEAAVAASAPTGAVPRPRRAKKSTGGAARAKKASGAAVPAPEAEAAPRKAAARKPATRKAAADKTAARKTAARTSAVRTSAARTPAARKPDAVLPGAEKAAGTGAEKPARTEEPPLRELVHALLVHAAEPRMVSEVTAELAQAHAGRKASGQVVRNTLEGLVKKGQVEKENRQGSVMYTAVRPAARTAVSDEVALAEAGTEPATDPATDTAATAAP
ncbi:hypothetical protein ACIA6C_17225 [Streptomyces sp. NPDC051578]|uniref:hypothetical protein n=1 Tax=Streptomyces sp. NPDC051578 TaxID=3365662 RepID=UPI0037A038E0